ncbi:hypothetical protein [Lentzea sp. CA-135723]|uniref:hypothetical protein n=1 Tax=Lentzea sp. CA-135723 TaxID=3239950 RepID=UPI003D8EC8D1
MSDSQQPTGDDPLRYRAAAAALEAALRSPWESSTSDEGWVKIAAARAALLECAPAAPTPWWPGGWVLCDPELTADPTCEASHLMWRTEEEAAADRPSLTTPSIWAVRWIPTETISFENADRPLVKDESTRDGVESWIRDESRRHRPLDEAFWRDRNSRQRLELTRYSSEGSGDWGVLQFAKWIVDEGAAGLVGNAAFAAVVLVAQRLSAKRRAAESGALSADQGKSQPVELQTLDIEVPPGAPPVIQADDTDTQDDADTPPNSKPDVG